MLPSFSGSASDSGGGRDAELWSSLRTLVCKWCGRTNQDESPLTFQRAVKLARLQSDDKEVKSAARQEASAIVDEYIQTKNEKGGGRVRAGQAAARVRVEVKRASALETRQLEGVYVALCSVRAGEQ